MRTDTLRSPRGHRHALRKEAKHIPPSSWEDIPINNKAAYKFADRLFPKCKNYSEFLHRFKAKFPKWVDQEIHALFYFWKQNASSKGRGV